MLYMLITTLLGNETILLAILGGFLIIILILLVWVSMLHARLGKLTRGKSGASLEEYVHGLIVHSKEVDQFMNRTKDSFTSVDARLKECVRKGSVARFNAFAGTGEGGSQSFATALVSEQGDGMVLSSLYTRDRMRIYAKPVTGYTSSLELTDEEAEVLKEAQAAKERTTKRISL